MATGNEAILAKLKAMREAKALATAQKNVDLPTPEEKATLDAQKASEVAGTPIEVAKGSITVSAMDPNSVIATDPQYQEFYEKMCAMEQAMNERMPNFAITLREVHRAMAEDVNVVTVLTNEEIGLICAGLARHADIEILEPKKSAAKKTVGGKLAKNLNEDSI